MLVYIVTSGSSGVTVQTDKVSQYMCDNEAAIILMNEIITISMLFEFICGFM